MKVLRIPLLLATVLATGIAGAAQPHLGSSAGGAGSAQFMLYLQKPLGEQTRSAGAARLGLRIDRVSTPHPANRASYVQRAAPAAVRLLDLRLSLFADRTVELNGVALNSRRTALGYESYGPQESWRNPWVWVGIGLAGALGISCATDNWPCDGNGSSEYEPPGE